MKVRMLINNSENSSRSLSLKTYQVFNPKNDENPLPRETQNHDNICYHGTGSVYATEIKTMGLVPKDNKELLTDINDVLEHLKTLIADPSLHELVNDRQFIEHGETLKYCKVEPFKIGLTTDYKTARIYAYDIYGERPFALMNIHEVISKYYFKFSDHQPLFKKILHITKKYKLLSKPSHYPVVYAIIVYAIILSGETFRGDFSYGKQIKPSQIVAKIEFPNGIDDK